MSERTYPTESTYRAPLTVNDNDGGKLDLTGATVKYAVTYRRGGEPIYQKTDADDEMTINNATEGEVVVEIPPEDLDWTGTVWEEWRITFSDGSSNVVLQRSVDFFDVTTST